MTRKQEATRLGPEAINEGLVKARLFKEAVAKMGKVQQISNQMELKEDASLEVDRRIKANKEKFCVCQEDHLLNAQPKKLSTISLLMKTDSESMTTS
jgi:hypothetical protein